VRSAPFSLQGSPRGPACTSSILRKRGPVALPNQPLAVNVFWTSLAVFDPLGALLLNVRPRAGIVLTIVIMTADVSVNVIAFRHFGLLSLLNFGLWLQAAFCLFALLCAPHVWREEGHHGQGTSPAHD